MSGYSGFSMSNNAVMAYDEGKLPASKLAKKLGVTTAAVRSVLRPCEWHHTSSQYNSTDFFDIDEIEDSELAEMKRLSKDEKKAAKVSTAFRAKVSWLDWSGSRKHPTCTEREEVANVVLKGKTYTIALDNGHTFRKRVGTNGFGVEEITSHHPSGVNPKLRSTR